jgi:cellulose 1,4-beta-cellobiosidase
LNRDPTDLFSTEPGTQTLAQIAAAAARVRGFAVNVAGYNAWISDPGEFEHLPDVRWYNKAVDEQRLVRLLLAELAKLGITEWRAIMDTSRNGVLGVRKDWLQWCNVVGAGIGVESTSDTGDNMIDTFAWIKNPGVSDGTGDKSATSYSSLCASEQGKSKRYIP